MTLNTVKFLFGPAILGFIVLFKKKKNLKQMYTITKKPIYRNTANTNFKKTIPINQSVYTNNIIKQIIPYK